RADERARKPVAAGPVALERGVPAFATNLHRMAVLCADAGVPLALMTQPSLYKDSPTPAEEAALITGSGATPRLAVGTLKRGLDAYNGAVRRVAKEDGCLLVDLAREVPGELECFFDDVHLTAKGNSVVAECIVRAILADGSLPRGNRPAR